MYKLKNVLRKMIDNDLSVSLKEIFDINCENPVKVKKHTLLKNKNAILVNMDTIIFPSKKQIYDYQQLDKMCDVDNICDYADLFSSDLYDLCFYIYDDDNNLFSDKLDFGLSNIISNVCILNFNIQHFNFDNLMTLSEYIILNDDKDNYLYFLQFNIKIVTDEMKNYLKTMGWKKIVINNIVYYYITNSKLMCYT